MELFSTVKTNISTIDAAERYGIEVNRHGKALCPFHNDRHPSLFVADDHYHCYACGEHGDVIDFTSKLYGLSLYDAAKKLAYALEFMKQEQNPKTYISAVVHMDEKTPHMHLCFVPLTADNRLSAKEIVGNKKKLSVWQDKFWAHMVQKYSTLERGESASESGRKHIPVRVFKQMTRLTKQKERLDKLLGDVKLTNYKERTQQIIAFLDKYIPDIEQMDTELQKYRATFESADAEIKALEKSNESMSEKLKKLQTESAIKKLKDNQLRQDYEDARAILDRIPPEILRQYRSRADNQKQEIHR